MRFLLPINHLVVFEKAFLPYVMPLFMVGGYLFGKEGL